MKEHQKIIHPSRPTDPLWLISFIKDLKHSIFPREPAESVERSALNIGAAPCSRTRLRKRNESRSGFPVCTAPARPQLNVFHSESVRPRRTYQCFVGNTDLLPAVNLTSALATSTEAWMSAEVLTWPRDSPMTPHKPGKGPELGCTSFTSLHRWRSWTPVLFVCAGY